MLHIVAGSRTTCQKIFLVSCKPSSRLESLAVNKISNPQLTIARITTDAEDMLTSWRLVDLVPAVIASSLPAVASVFSRHVKLPPSLSNYLGSHGSSSESPKVFLSESSNPFTSEKSDSASFHGGGRTNRDRYEEAGGLNVFRCSQDTSDLESSRASWEIQRSVTALPEPAKLG